MLYVIVWFWYGHYCWKHSRISQRSTNSSLCDRISSRSVLSFQSKVLIHNLAGGLVKMFEQSVDPWELIKNRFQSSYPIFQTFEWFQWHVKMAILMKILVTILPCHQHQCYQIQFWKSILITIFVFKMRFIQTFRSSKDKSTPFQGFKFWYFIFLIRLSFPLNPYWQILENSSKYFDEFSKNRSD